MAHDEIAILDGSTFLVSDRRGDIDASPDQPHGFFYQDTRFLSRWTLWANGEPLEALSTDETAYFGAQFFLVPPGGDVNENPSTSIIRKRSVGDGFHEDVTVINHDPVPLELELRLDAGSDFADLFEVKDALAKKGELYRRGEGGTPLPRYPRGDLVPAPPAAGLPWFMTVFGRDSLITSYQALPFAAELAETTLRVLARYQGTKVDPFRDEFPGRILHEIRFGELTHFEERPHSPYYGAADTTPLFLILLDEVERWTGNGEIVRELEPAARAALAYLDEHGDLDGDGYVEYERALDGEKRPVDALTSNIGHLLWSGIVGTDRAEQVAAHLVDERLFSGWGVRTMAMGEGGYNPIRYHNGTVWPHDNSLIATGLGRYGFREEAARVAFA